MKKLALLCCCIVALISCQNQDSLFDMNTPGNLVPETVTTDPLLPRVKVNGTVLHAETFGDIQNPIIIFLHGGPGSDYRPMISEFMVENASRYPNERKVTNAGLTRLQDEYFCIFYDQRGAGLSTRYDPGVMDFDMYVDDLDAIVNYYLDQKLIETGVQDDQVYLFGWSFGGILATGYINAYPEKVKDVVLYESGPLTFDNWEYFKENSTGLTSQLGDEWVEEFLMSHDHISPDTHEKADFQIAIPAFRAQPELHEHPETPAWRFGAFLRGDNLDFSQSESFDITSNLRSFNGNMVFVSGSLTANEYPEYSESQMAVYPVSQYVEIEGTGHTGPWEKAEEVSGIIRTQFN
jgi:proline iminopeptidase